jgi:hypothetical protein
MNSKNLILDKSTKIQLAIEEWLANEFEILAKQQDSQLIAQNTRFVAIDGLVYRQNKFVSTHSYIFTSDYWWVVISQPVLKKLDQNAQSIFIKLILETLIELENQQKTRVNGKIDHLTIKSCEITAYNRIIQDLEKISQSKKQILQLERIKQTILFLTSQYLKTHYPVVDPQILIPVKSDKPLQLKLQAAFHRIRTKLYSIIDSQVFAKLKFRILPYFFLVVEQHDQSSSSELRIRPLLSLEILDSQNSYSFSIILINTYLVETLEVDFFEVILAYEIIAMINSRKYSRGEMEKEIFQIISKSQKDENFDSLKSYYEQTIIEQAISRTKQILEQSNKELRYPILQVFD